MLEDKQGEEMEKNSLGRGALESVLRESFSGDLFELRKKRMGERTNINVWVKSILEIKNSVWKGLQLGKKLGYLQHWKETTLIEDFLCTSDHAES